VSGKVFGTGIIILMLGTMLLLSFVYTPNRLLNFLPIFGCIGFVATIIGSAIMYVGMFSRKSAEEEILESGESFAEEEVEEHLDAFQECLSHLWLHPVTETFSPSSSPLLSTKTSLTLLIFCSMLS